MPCASAADARCSRKGNPWPCSTGPRPSRCASSRRYRVPPPRTRGRPSRTLVCSNGVLVGEYVVSRRHTSRRRGHLAGIDGRLTFAGRGETHRSLPRVRPQGVPISGGEREAEVGPRRQERLGFVRGRHALFFQENVAQADVAPARGRRLSRAQRSAGGDELRENTVRMRVPRKTPHIRIDRGGGDGGEDLRGIVAVIIVIVVLYLLFSC